jgi:hypothetical protein
LKEINVIMKEAVDYRPLVWGNAYNPVALETMA